MKRLFYIAIILLVSAIWFGCSTTKYIPLESVRYDTTYVNKYQYDSIYKRDSIVVRDKGDTVFIEKYRYLYRDKLLHDTLYFSKTDSIHVPYPVERKLTRWEQFKVDVGGFAVSAVVVAVLIVFGIFVYKLKK